MKWVLQTNLYNEEVYDELLQTLNRLGLEKVLVKCIPFGGGLEVVEGTLPGDGAAAIVMGSYTLARVAQERRWAPGAFLKNLDFCVQHAWWGDGMLNADASIGSMWQVPTWIYARYIDGPFFVRPVHDTKAFTGEVSDWPTFQAWLDRLAAMRRENNYVDPPDAQVTLDTMVMVCTKKEIYSETRTWIVNGRVVTASGYKVGTLKRYTGPELVDEHITAFAQRCADIWCPNEAFVLDVADTPDGLKIVEVNNLNSAGWYKADLQKLVAALEAL